MSDLLLISLKKIKSYSDMDISYALICAELCNQTYFSNNDVELYLKNYGFTDIKFATEKNSHALMAIYDNDIFIAIRGTNFSDKNDVFDNADIKWTKEGNGFVHSGYKRHIDLIWNEIKIYIASYKNKNIIITGHSMGGACAQILNNRLPGSIGYYYGSPRVVDKTIRNENKSLAYSLENKYDVAPELPPKILGFCSIGRIFSIRNISFLEKENKWYNSFYSIFYTLIYFLMILCNKCFGFKTHLKDLILINHEIEDYILNIKQILKR